MWDIILDAIKNALNWFLDTLLGFGNYVLALVLDLLPTDANGAVTGAWSYVQTTLLVANAWVPLDFAISLCLIYVTFVLAFLGAKILIKLIP